MSSDFAFWKAGDGEPGDIYDGLVDGMTAALEPHTDVALFRGELLFRRPDLAAVLEPTELDVLDVPDDGVKYVLLSLPAAKDGELDDIFQLARKYRLQDYRSVA